MKILNIHGYKGSAKNSAYCALTECGYDVCSVGIDYDSEMPLSVLERLCVEYEKNECDAVVGTSLGGFFAALICVKKNCPALFINPCLLPCVVLPELGYSNENGISEFSSMTGDISDIDVKNVSAVVGLKDEIIKNHDYTKKILGNERYYSVEGGRHSGATLPLKEIITKYGKEIFLGGKL